MEAGRGHWRRTVGFARQLVSFYDPELHRLLFEVKS
jgi:hypothetical protein